MREVEELDIKPGEYILDFIVRSKQPKSKVSSFKKNFNSRNIMLTSLCVNKDRVEKYGLRNKQRNTTNQQRTPKH